MSMTFLTRRLGLRAMAAAALLALGAARGGLAQEIGRPILPDRPEGPAVVAPAADPPAAIPLSPAAPANPNDSPAMRALILDTIKQSDAAKKKADDDKKKAEEERIAREGLVVGDDRKLNVTFD